MRGLDSGIKVLSQINVVVAAVLIWIPQDQGRGWLISGRFEPAEVLNGSSNWERRSTPGTNISFAVDIDYGTALMRSEGLFEHE